MDLLFYCTFLFSAVAALSVDKFSVVCRNENGDPVDWYYLYKLPKDYLANAIETSSTTATGLRYLYISSETKHQGWQLSSRTIRDSYSFAGQTLSPLLGNNRTDTLLVAYNDETPAGEVNFYEGHTKGVIAADSETGFWLVHSVPKYPPIDRYDYPETGTHYGQSFLCLSLNFSQIDLVGKQQLYNEPNIYYSRIPDQFHSKLSNLVRASQKKWNNEAPYSNLLYLTTADEGHEFRSFAKNSKFGKELYEDWVAPQLNGNLLVESWRNGGGKLPTNCTRIQYVLNVAQIANSDFNLSFHSTKDHSKWCVSQLKDENWICVGDINRAEHQLKRGGGTVCQLNREISTAYRNLVVDIEPCPVVNDDATPRNCIFGLKCKWAIVAFESLKKFFYNLKN